MLQTKAANLKPPVLSGSVVGADADADPTPDADAEYLRLRLVAWYYPVVKRSRVVRATIDAAYCQSPDKWIYWPRLPLIRLSDGASGVLVDNGRPVVYLFNLFDTPTTEPESVEYQSFDALVAEWRVD